MEDLYHNQWRVVQAHWKQLEEMETLCRKEGRLLCQQPDMAFGEYIHKLGELMERKARCVHSMIAQLQPYLKTSPSNQ
ncbi:kinesin-like protein KIF24 [Symphorus nematophorus]